MLGVSRETVDRAIRDGKISRTKLRGRVLIPASEAARFGGG
jgi:excisionase family DNA binding protein